MSFQSGSEPLHHHPLVRTREPDEMRQEMLAQFGASSFAVPTSRAAFEARGNGVKLDDLALAFCAYSSPASAEFPEADFARLQINLKGRAATVVNGATVEINAKQGCVSSPGRISSLKFGEGYEQMVLRIGRDGLIKKLAALVGFLPKGELAFDAAFDTESAAGQALVQLTSFCCAQLNAVERAVPSPVLRELEQAIMVSFLCATRHGFNHLLDRDVSDGAPWHVRRTEEFIEANWRNAIEIEDLTRLTGVGARTLARGFAAHRGYSPREFVKQVRLKQARSMLNSGSTAVTVTGVALACNFGSLGRFAKDYHDAFGELPSVTLERGKRARS